MQTSEGIGSKDWLWWVILRDALVVIFAVPVIILLAEGDITGIAVSIAYGLNLIVSAGMMYRKRWALLLAVASDCTAIPFVIGLLLFFLGYLGSVEVNSLVAACALTVLLFEGVFVMRKQGRRKSNYVLYWLISAVCGYAGYVLGTLMPVAS